jgi:hypothetical protein
LDSCFPFFCWIESRGIFGAAAKEKAGEMILMFVWLTGGSGVILLAAGTYTHKKALGVAGQSLLCSSFALISISLIHTTKFLVGIAFGISALSQAAAVIRWQIRRGRASKS